jgi:ABC-2 type transport system permease protein
VIRSADSAQPMTAALTLPLYLISGIFLTTALLPNWLLNVAGVFPLRPFQQAFARRLQPLLPRCRLRRPRPADHGRQGLAGLLVAARRFRWTPQAG